MITRLKKVIWNYFSHKAMLFGRAADYLLDPEYFPPESYSHARGQWFKAKQELYQALADAFVHAAPKPVKEQNEAQ